MDISSKKKVLLINPKLIFPKTVFSEEYMEFEGSGAFDQKSMNIGLLAVASYVDMLGYEVKLIDLQEHVSDTSDLIAVIDEFEPNYIGISCNSCYSYIKTIDHTKLIRQHKEDLFIFAGGVHIGAIALTAMDEIPELDCIIKYEGELPIQYILEASGENLADIPGIVYRSKGEVVETEDKRLQVELDDLPFLKWSLYPDFKRLVPNIELSRGCRYTCKFCTNSYSYCNSYRSKSADKIFDEIMYTLSEYENSKQAIYLGGMIFDMKDENLLRLVEKLKENPIVWRTESRVDCLTSEDVKILIATGLETIDWGLDSASPDILKIMRKATSPKAYLNKAIKLFEELKDEPILNKANIMFYPGETAETLCDNMSFLINNRHIIDIVSPKPTMLYPGTTADQEYEQYHKLYGTEKIRTAFWDKVHAYPMNLSSQLSYEQAKMLSLILERMLNDYDDYSLNRKTSIGFSDLSKEEYLNYLLKENDIYNLRFKIDSSINHKIQQLSEKSLSESR